MDGVAATCKRTMIYAPGIQYRAGKYDTIFNHPYWNEEMVGALRAGTLPVGTGLRSGIRGPGIAATHPGAGTQKCWLFWNSLIFLDYVFRPDSKLNPIFYVTENTNFKIPYFMSRTARAISNVFETTCFYVWYSILIPAIGRQLTIDPWTIHLPIAYAQTMDEQTPLLRNFNCRHVACISLADSDIRTPQELKNRVDDRAGLWRRNLIPERITLYLLIKESSKDKNCIIRKLPFVDIDCCNSQLWMIPLSKDTSEPPSLVIRVGETADGNVPT